MDRRRPLGAIVLLSCILFAESSSGKEWSYTGDTGPRNWKKAYPDCEGKYQSPVNIAKTREKKNMQPLRLKNYNQQLDEPTLSNNGHTLKLTVHESKAKVSGGCLDGEYQFDHLHFHWGSENDRGSEHTIEDHRFAMELHLVHVNTKYDNIEEALLHGDGLAVVGVFYEVRPFNSSSLDAIVKGAAKIQHVHKPVEIENEDLSLESLLPLEQQRFYCYRNGSLTTPDCSTAVTFTLFASPVHIGQKQIDVFRGLRYGNASSSPYMMDNFRPIQETNKRKIYYYNDSRTLHSSPSLLASILFLTLVASLCV